MRALSAPLHRVAGLEKAFLQLPGAPLECAEVACEDRSLKQQTRRWVTMMGKYVNCSWDLLSGGNSQAHRTPVHRSRQYVCPSPGQRHSEIGCFAVEQLEDSPTGASPTCSTARARSAATTTTSTLTSENAGLAERVGELAQLCVLGPSNANNVVRQREHTNTPPGALFSW